MLFESYSHSEQDGGTESRKWMGRDKRIQMTVREFVVGRDIQLDSAEFPKERPLPTVLYLCLALVVATELYFISCLLK